MSIIDRFLKPNIAKLKKNRDIKGLAKAVTHKDADVRRAAVDALGKMRIKKAIDPLISALSNQDGYVRKSAAIALGKFKNSRIREPLGKRLEDDWLEVSRNAAWSLIKIGAIDIVIEALKHSKEKVREVAAEALGGSNDMKAVVPLVEALKDENKHVRREAAEALKAFKAEEARELIRKLKQPIYQVKNKRDIISRMIRRFKEPNDSEEDEYLAAIEAIERADSSIRMSVIDKVIPNMIKTMRDFMDWRNYLGSIKVLEDLGPNVLPSIEKSWKQGKDDEIRWCAGTVFSWASAIHEKQGIPELIELLQDADAGIRNCADLYLCCMGSRKTEKAIRSFFEPLTGKHKNPSESQKSAIVESIQDSSAERLGKEELIDKLLWIYSLPTNFLYAGLVPARKIGKRLYEIDGRYMQEAWKIIMEKRTTQEEAAIAATLDGAWAGIGGWLP